ncbi:MAG: GGDEF domain-containing protein [Clostridia bacterium]|nr:GGDEF domain-containing protein [Clostridia bacterium]
MRFIKSLLLYAGLDREEFQVLQHDAQAENEKNLKTYSLVALVIFAVLSIANPLIYDSTTVNETSYILLALVNLGVFLGARFLAPGRPRLTIPLCYIFMGALYAVSLVLTLLHPQMPAVTAIVLLFAVPFLVVDRPIRLVVMTAAITAALCVLSLALKPADIARMDLWNGISFATVAIVVEILQQRSKYRMLSQSRRIKYLSETDTLTGAKNRNRYESRRDSYAQRCWINLACVYADVNGLHELNNAEGHRAGDVMLQTVARELIDCFGPEHTYRIGGDEFVCFRMDAPEAQTRQDVSRVCEHLAAQGYDISVGIAIAEKAGLDIKAMTSEAESAMYLAKREYYRQSGRDRRRR